MVVDIGEDDRFPLLQGADVYLYLHEDGVISVAFADGRVMQQPLNEVIETVHRAQEDDGRAWISGPDSPLGLAALDAIFATKPKPLEPWSATAPPVRWRNGACGFLAAAQYGQDEVLDDLIDRGVDLSWRDDDGNGALHCAAYGKNEHAVTRLVRAGATIDDRNDQGYTPEMISLAQGTDPITRLLLEQSTDTRDAARGFRNGHWLRRAIGVPAFLAWSLLVLGLTMSGAIPPVAAVLAVGLPAILTGLLWKRLPPRLVGSVRRIDGSELTLQRGAFRRATIDLRSVPSAAHIGPVVRRTRPGIGYMVVPSDLGGAWSAPRVEAIGAIPTEADALSHWPSVLLIEYDRMWRDEVVLPIARQLVLARADVSAGLRTEIKDAVMQAAQLAAEGQQKMGVVRRLMRWLRIRYRP